MITSPDDHARARIHDDLDATMLVVAGAGTGKTTALVRRIVQLVSSGTATLRELAAITFTEAAAAELRDRVRRAIDAEAATRPEDAKLSAARQEVDEAAISTLHAFAQRILTEHCVAAGIPPGFEVMDDTTERADFDTRWERFADELLADADAEPALVRGFALGLSHLALAEVARALHEQRDRLDTAAVDALRAAGPETSGWPAVTALPVLEAIDQALAKAGSCTDPDDKLSVHLREVLTPARAQLTAASDEQTLLQALDNTPSLQCKYGQAHRWGGSIDDVRALCTSAEQARRDLLTAVRRAVVADLGVRLVAFVSRVAEDRRVEGRLGFHDLLVVARDLLRSDTDALGALQRRYRRLLVDEFQDTDPIQVELAARLAATTEGSDDLRHLRPGALFLVWDPEQSIYRFRRADIDLFGQVREQIGDVIGLRTNFRSVPGILAFVNTVFDELFGDAPDPGQAPHQELVGERGPLDGGRGDRHHGPNGPNGSTGGSPVQLQLEGFTPMDEPDAEVTAPATRSRVGRRRGPPPAPPVVVLGGPRTDSLADIRRSAGNDVAEVVTRIVGDGWQVEEPEDGTVRPARWRDVAVLLPARTALPALEEAFEDHAVPYRLEGVAMLWASDDVHDVLAVLHAADDPADPVAVLTALRSPGLACGDDDLVGWRQSGGTWDPRAPAPPGMEDHPVALAMTTLRRLRDERWWSEPSAMVGHVIAELRGFEVCLASRRPRDHWHRLRWLWDQARFFDETTGGTLRDFLRWAELEAADDRRTGGVGPPDPDDDAVRVMTIHGAKGLEFPVVVLAGLERDPTAGHRLPAVLWDDDGTPELSAGVDFRTAGYELIAARERHLDALEQDRLLYVGMTRARDHLFVCLHHKQTNTATPAARLTELCERHRELWRRPPLTVGQSPEAEHPPEAEQPPEAEEWRMYVRDFEARRVKLLSAARRAPVTTATAVAAALSGSGRAPRSGDEPVESSGGGPGAAEDAPFADWEAARLGVPSQDEEVALRIGRAVHGALAVIDLETGTDEAGHAAEIVARGRATAFGVSAHAGTVAAMVDTARRAPTVAAGATRRHWRELYVAAPVGRDGVLEGFVDLVIEEPDGLVVVDYKTDRIDGPGGATATGSHYLPQLASYAECLEAATGRAVHRCVLVFVAGGEPIEVSYDGDTLAAARARVLVAASDLVAAP